MRVIPHNKARSLIFNVAESTSTRSQPGEVFFTILYLYQETKSGDTVQNGSKPGPQHPRSQPHSIQVIILTLAAIALGPTVYAAPLLHIQHFQ